MTHANVVPCEVSAPADHVGDVMAELFRIGGQIQDMQHQESRTLLRVGIPYDNLILFEKWLFKTFHGTATSTLLPINCEPAMSASALLAGFFAAHSVWSVSDGETLVPIYAYIDASGARHLERLVTGSLEWCVDEGRKWLSENPHHAQCAVLIFDGFIPLADGKTDALILEIANYGDVAASVAMAVPYVPQSTKAMFKVYRPKIIKFPSGHYAQGFIESFWKGVDEHKRGAEIWASHLDQSK